MRKQKHLWIGICDALYNCLEDPSFCTLPVTGLNCLRLGIYTKDASSRFFSKVLHELKAKGPIFKDEWSRGLLNEICPHSGRDLVASSDAGAPQLMILYTPPPLPRGSMVPIQKTRVKLQTCRLKKPPQRFRI